MTRLAAALTLLLSTLWVSTAAAQPDSAALAARASFEAGVEAARAERWAEAATHFRASHEATPTPVATFNWIIALRHLQRFAQLLELADRFLQDAPEEPFASEREQVAALRAEAIPRVARVDWPALPVGAVVRVTRTDQDAPSTGARRWLAPGEYLVEATNEDGRRAAAVYSLEPGDQVRVELAWTSPTVEAEGGTSETSARPSGPPEGSSSSAVAAASGSGSRWHRPAALALAGLGAVAWVSATAMTIAAFRLASPLTSTPTDQSGFLSRTMTYRRSRAAGNGLALGAAVLTTAAALLAPRRPVRGALRWVLFVVGAALVGTGAALGLRRGPRLGDTRLTAPTRLLGATLTSLGAPLMAFPFDLGLGT